FVIEVEADRRDLLREAAFRLGESGDESKEHGNVAPAGGDVRFAHAYDHGCEGLVRSPPRWMGRAGLSKRPHVARARPAPERSASSDFGAPIGTPRRGRRVERGSLIDSETSSSRLEWERHRRADDDARLIAREGPMTRSTAPDE